MLQDGAEITRGTDVNTDVCIVGGGPAGISVALQLAETTRLNIVLLESGGLVAEQAIQDLNSGLNLGLDYYDLAVTRHRALGGSSNLWPGWCRPLDPLDFEGRSWVPDTGWPVSYEEFRPYYHHAARLCQLESEQWSPTAETPLPPLYREPFLGNDVEIALWQGSPPTRFGIVYRTELAASSQVTVLVNATAVAIDNHEHEGRAHATGVRVATLDGNEFTVKARVTVLAAGALETARLLLASRSGRTTGLGNENDIVGRYFMEHPHLVTGRIALFQTGTTARRHLNAIDRGIGGARARMALQRPTGSTKAAYTITRSRQVSDQLLNFSTHLQTVGPVSREDSEVYRGFKLVAGNLRSPGRLYRQVRGGSVPVGALKLLSGLVRGAPEVASIVFREALRRPKELALYTQSEQSPNRDSRVTLDSVETDALGVPRLRLDWHLARIDKESVIRAQSIVGSQLESAGLGQLVPEPPFTDDSADWGSHLRGGHHQLGTARMSTDPKKGVVNANGRVHTVRNLYVADSAVFPSGGYANSLLTTVAWAVRLADTVGRRYR